MVGFPHTATDVCTDGWWAVPLALIDSRATAQLAYPWLIALRAGALGYGESRALESLAPSWPSVAFLDTLLGTCTSS